MCGIAGIISRNNKPVSQEEIVKMADMLQHRGPDGEGFLFTDSGQFCEGLRRKRPGALVKNIDNKLPVALGHRRLSIVDLSPDAAQPMSDVSGRYFIVFNGEIYNHAEIRKELEGQGAKFVTDHSDTEVVIEAYKKWGTTCLERFNGMWAFCIWDTGDDTFFIARDRAGKKPFYYAEHEGRIYFASELKAVLVNRSISRELDDRAIYDYLTYTMVPAPRTIFKGVRKLPAAHFIFFKRGEPLEAKQYWWPYRKRDFLSLPEEEIARELRAKLEKAAEIRYVADVEVGCLLSGGVDSSVNLACVSRVKGRRVKAFSVGFENRDGYVNEFKFARKAAELFNAEYHELTLTEKEFVDFLPKMVYFQDEPIADPANIPIYYISSVARKNNVKVLLGGEGSDELFSGYKHWTLSRGFSKLLDGRPWLTKLASGLHKNTPLKRKRTLYIDWYDKLARRQPAFWSGTELRSEREKGTILTRSFLDRVGAYDSFSPISEEYENFLQRRLSDPYDWMTGTDLQNRLPDLLLARLDRMTMAASVEGRNPFLDKNVIEFAATIPPGLKYKNGEEKYILKKAFEGVLPNEILYRPKDSFTVPMERIFRDKNYLGEGIRLLGKLNADRDLFHRDFLTGLENGKGGKELWNLLNLAYWYDEYK